MELGWDEGVVNDLHEFLLYLQETRDGAGPEAVAWAVGQWAHALILAEEHPRPRRGHALPTGRRGGGAKAT